MRPEQGSPVRADTDAAALLDRLQKLRNLLPAFAQETAAARREAARLRLQNTKLQTRRARSPAETTRHNHDRPRESHSRGKLALRLS